MCYKVKIPMFSEERKAFSVHLILGRGHDFLNLANSDFWPGLGLRIFLNILSVCCKSLGDVRVLNQLEYDCRFPHMIRCFINDKERIVSIYDSYCVSTCKLFTNVICETFDSPRCVKIGC